MAASKQTTRPLAALIGRNILAARHRAEETQTETAYAVGVTQARVSSWERGESVPSDYYQGRLADHFFHGDVVALVNLDEGVAA